MQTEEKVKNIWNDLSKYVKRKAKSKTDDKIRKVLEKSGDKNSEKVNTTEEISRIDDDKNDSDVSLSEDELKYDNIKIKEKHSKKKKKNDDNEVEFFEDVALEDENVSFYQMNLSRPLMKAISDMKFVHPTPIQATTIPNALLGNIKQSDSL